MCKAMRTSAPPLAAPIILASLSPTRAQILAEHGITFIQMDSGFDEESLAICEPAKFAYIACVKKLESSLELLAKQGKYDHALDSGLLCADSVVSVDGKLLRKARDKQEARNMLELQDSKRISILTAIAYKSRHISFTDLSACHLELGEFELDDMLGYVDSLAWQGKAGCVMVEGFHKRYIRRQIGLESSALGLSIEKLVRFWEIV